MTIAQGIAGAAAYHTDDGDRLGCFACTPTNATFEVVTTTSRVDDEAGAVELLRSDAPREDVDIEGRYERALDVGSFLACAVEGGSGVCAPFVVESDRVTTLHVHTTFGPPSLQVLAPDGSDDFAAFDVTLPEGAE